MPTNSVNVFADNITIEGAHIVIRNFRGLPNRFNPAGKRNFCVLVDDSIADKLLEDGWNIHRFKDRETGELKEAYMQVAVAYGRINPKIVMLTTNGKTTLDDTNVGLLDVAEIQNCDLVIRPYTWEANGKSGIKAYVKTMYVTIAEDEFEKKYGDLPNARLEDSEED